MNEGDQPGEKTSARADVGHIHARAKFHEIDDLDAFVIDLTTLTLKAFNPFSDIRRSKFLIEMLCPIRDRRRFLGNG